MKRLLPSLLLLSVLVTGAVRADVMDTDTGVDNPSQKLNIETHDFLISKLESVLSATPKGDRTRVPALLRLADVYAERARLQFIHQMAEPGAAQTCKACEADRTKAIQKYETALDESKGSVRSETESRILFQLAYLYEQSGKNQRASELYKRVLSLGPKHFSQTVLGQSEAGLGELEFKANRFAKAKTWFQAAAKRKETPRRGWIEYRLAWCEYNLGQAEAGQERLIRILKSPALMTMDATKGAKIDASFQEDLARDLSLFYVRTGFTERDVQVLLDLTPEKARKSVLVGLAEEAERLGQKRPAIAVWNTLISKNGSGLDSRERIEASARVAYLQYGLGEKSLAVAEMARGLEIWKKAGCSPEAECAILQKRFRKLVLDWNKAEETKPTAQLLGAYTAYSGFFVKDAEMSYWAGNVARELVKPSAAVALYRASAQASHDQIPHEKDEKQLSSLKKVFEGSLVAEIEMAEATGDAKIRTQAYTHYLELNPEGQKEFEVRYQLAHLAYKRGEHREASEQFHTLALKKSAKQNTTLAKQAADLALDSLVLLKDDERLEAWALEFAEAYPVSANEYRTIARKARLNIAARVASNSTSNSELNDNISKLKAMDLRNASREETLLSCRNRFVLAEKAKNFAEAESAIAAELRTPGLSEAEKEKVKSRQLWLYEMQLKFNEAYKTAQSMEFADLSKADRELKLSMLAELAGQDARPHLRKFLVLAAKGRDAKSREGELAARIKILKLSGFSMSEWKAQAPALKRDAKVFAAAAVEVYARHKSPSVIKDVLKDIRTARTADGHHLLRAQEQKSIESFLASRSKVPAIREARAQAAIRSRIQWLGRADAFANTVIKKGDPWLETVVLSVVAYENKTLADEIRALPEPKGLTAPQVKAYAKLLNDKVRPFEMKAQKIATKLQFFAASERVLSNYEADLMNSRDARLAFLTSEARFLARSLKSGALASLSVRLDSMTEAAERKANEAKSVRVQNAMNDVRDNPFDLNSIRALRDLESQRGRETMVAYLDTRMKRLQSTNTESKR